MCAAHERLIVCACVCVSMCAGVCACVCVSIELHGGDCEALPIRSSRLYYSSRDVMAEGGGRRGAEGDNGS